MQVKERLFRFNYVSLGLIGMCGGRDGDVYDAGDHVTAGQGRANTEAGGDVCERMRGLSTNLGTRRIAVVNAVVDAVQGAQGCRSGNRREARRQPVKGGGLRYYKSQAVPCPLHTRPLQLLLPQHTHHL